MKLVHDIENDLEHTIPPVSGEDTEWLFEGMTRRTLALVEPFQSGLILDLACGMGQDTLALARKTTEINRLANNDAPPEPTRKKGRIVGSEPSNRMIRYAQQMHRKAQVQTPFIRALAEELPFASGSFSGVVCKGAMDHFMDPELTMKEIARILRPGGGVVLAIANYDSLSCRLGKLWDAFFHPDGGPAEPYYEPPPDHLTRFGHRNILDLIAPPLKIEKVEGISLLWHSPIWMKLLGVLPKFLKKPLLYGAFSLARMFPSMADVVVVKAVKQPS